jgi:hypothetical protein
MLEVFLRKFKLIANQYMPAIMDKFDEKGNMKPIATLPTTASATAQSASVKKDGDANVTTSVDAKTEPNGRDIPVFIPPPNIIN